MSYQYITSHDSPNYTPGRYGRRPEGIVIHWWDEKDRAPSFDGVVSWLCRADGTSSAHYVVEAGRVACIVSCANTAWHAGDYGVNTRTIGIECNPRMSDGDLETVAELIADIRNTYGRLPLSKHRDYQQTTCPGTYADKLGWLDQRAEQLRGNTNAAPASPARLAQDGWIGPETVAAWQQVNSTPIDKMISSQSSALKPLHQGINPACIEYVPPAQAQGSQLIIAVQKTLKRKGLYGGDLDGFFGPGTIKGLQLYYGTPADSVISAPSRMVIELQRALNKQLGR